MLMPQAFCSEPLLLATGGSVARHISVGCPVYPIFHWFDINLEYEYIFSF
jgi:hypothetical protein